MLANKSYRIGYNFQNRIKKHLISEGWNVLTQPKSAFPDHLCWKVNGCIIEGNIKNESLTFDVIFVECKCNKYLSKEEKEKAIKILKDKKCSHFYVAHRKKFSRSLYFYELFKNKATKEVEL